ncbi:MAG: alpha/beta fold hydrolase [Planctomycetes bacterium]|nr:alpha/beta fold hydrolase [Planctomycetota bacterium]
MLSITGVHHLPCRGRLRASVVLLHGYAAEAAVHRGDCAAFVDGGIEVVLPDAPGHGHRADGTLARIAVLPPDERLAAILALARSWSLELPALAAACRRRGALRVGLVGISMGGFAALAAMPAPCPFDAVAALLAAPVLVDPAAVAPCRPPLLLGLAGRDEVVPPAPGRRFARDYGAELHEYPESTHLMRGEDWSDLWGRTGAFLGRHLLVG